MKQVPLFLCPLLASLCEVGGDPDHFGISLGKFHSLMEERTQISQDQSLFRLPMNSTSTHDTKRSEDVRARINVLSEIPALWDQAVRKWSASNMKHVLVDGSPDKREQYFLYQTLLGVWPVGVGSRNSEAISAVEQRVSKYLQKSMREAKINTFWTSVNEKHENAVNSFLSGILADQEFLDDFLSLQGKISRCGMYSSLSQTLIKAMSPGVPDFYQGCELWDFSLVDPDNRRPVDFDARKKILDSILDEIGVAQVGIQMKPEAASFVGHMLRNPENGHIKMFVTLRSLTLRNLEEALFRDGTYVELDAHGPRAGHVISFARVLAEKLVIVVATRFFWSILNSDGQIVPDAWRGTTLSLSHLSSKDTQSRNFYNVLSGQSLVVRGGEIPLESILGNLSVAILYLSNQGFSTSPRI